MCEKLVELKKEVDKFKAEYKAKREKYEMWVNVCNFLIPVLTFASAVFVLLSYSENAYEDFWKGCATVSSILSVGVTYWGKNNNYGAKLIQRGTTYFSLCELSRKIEFCENPEDEYREFVELFEKIMKRDNTMSLANSTEIVEFLNKNFMKNLEYESNIFKERKC